MAAVRTAAEMNYDCIKPIEPIPEGWVGVLTGVSGLGDESQSIQSRQGLIRLWAKIKYAKKDNRVRTDSTRSVVGYAILWDNLT